MKVDIKKYLGDVYQIDVMMEGKASRMACYYIDSKDPILIEVGPSNSCLLYTSPSPRDRG